MLCLSCQMCAALRVGCQEADSAVRLLRKRTTKGVEAPNLLLTNTTSQRKRFGGSCEHTMRCCTELGCFRIPMVNVLAHAACGSEFTILAILSWRMLTSRNTLKLEHASNCELQRMRPRPGIRLSYSANPERSSPKQPESLRPNEL